MLRRDLLIRGKQVFTYDVWFLLLFKKKPNNQKMNETHLKKILLTTRIDWLVTIDTDLKR